MGNLLYWIIGLALIFDFINGFHDAANSIATVVSTKVLTPFQAVVWAAVFNFAAYFIFKDHGVANTVAKTVNEGVNSAGVPYITLTVIMAGLLAAIFWNLLTWWFGIPSSSSHTLIGGFAGSAIAHAGFEAIDSDIILKTASFIFLAPLVGMIMAFIISIWFLHSFKKTFLPKLLSLAILGCVFYFIPNPTNATTLAKGTVVFVQGEAYLRDNSGKLSAIKPGDVVTEGQEVVTRGGAVVELRLPSGAKVSIGPDRELLLNDEFFATASPERSENTVSSLGAEADRVIQALNAGKDPFEDLEDPAAGLTGGSVGDQTHDFVRLVRVLEEVTPVSYNYTTTGDGVDFLPASTFTSQTTNTPPLAADDSVTGTEDQPLVVDVLANDSDANNDVLTVTSATAVNGQVTINPDGSLRYVPNPDFNGPDTVTYTISDGKGGTSTATVTQRRRGQ